MPKKSLMATALPALAVSVALAAGGPTTVAAQAASTASVSCTTSKLALHIPGQLTVATDTPAYPPYFENNKPANGKGFESAVAYAVAKQLGLGSHVKWVPESFNASYAPGPKSFDFDINEISITPQRAKAVSFSTPYYANPQAIIVAKGSPLAHANSLAAFKNASIGVQIGTTSLTAVQQRIKPSKQPSIFDTSNDVISAFKIHRVNAIVVDYATALYLTSAELSKTTIAGQFTEPGGDNWGLLLAKGSKLTPCVDKALTKLKSNGTLTKLTKQWMSSKVAVPVLK